MKKIHHRKPLPTTGEEKGCQTHLPAIVGTSQALSETPVKAEQRQAVVGGGGKGEESPGQHCHRRKPHRNRLGARHLRNVTPPHRRCSSREGSPDSCSILDMPPFMSTNNMSVFLLQLREPNRNLNFPKPPRNPSTSLHPIRVLFTSMAWLRKALRHGPVVTLGQAAISTSALMPDSNLASTEALSAASAAVAELFHSLDFVLDQFGDEEEPGDQLQYHLDRLSAEAEKYTASSLDNSQGEEWPWYVLPSGT